MQASSLSFADTDYSADAVECCPGEPHLFAVGTYQVLKAGERAGAPQSAAERGEADEVEEVQEGSPEVTRCGRCLLYEVDGEGRNLKEKQRIEGPAILDMKWSPRPWQNQTTLAIADAKGHVQLHGLDSETKLLYPLQTVDCADESTLCLSLDWSTRRQTTPDPASIVVSLSSGEICTLGGESSFEVTSTWHGHDFEPWIAAFDCWEPSTVWTGGDDLTLKGWDLRQGCDRPTFVNKRSFEGGVTTIQSHQLVENLFAVGSYDSRIRLFDRRKPLVPLTEFDAGGGIWRLKWHASNPNRLLVAGMHGGFKVIDFDGLSLNGGANAGGWLEPGEGKLHARFDGHDSLAYGVDWSDGGRTSEGKDLVASCSFYDHALHVWSC
ncbi:diphthamide synthase [Rhodotorula paludigena]|uniref:diphthamide synthase n=1 Tax=Rhodotorula paludigena TaxID=86838 RepID=UPI003178B973